MIVISDSTVLINFALLNLFQCLKALFGKLIIPREVYSEVYINGNARPGSEEVLNAKQEGWICVEEITDTVFYEQLRSLHRGEREALTLVHQYKSDFLLTDDGAAIRACIIHFPETTYLRTPDVGELMLEKGITSIHPIQMSIKLRQLRMV